MAFLILGILLLAMKMAELGSVAVWPWWIVLAPFGLAVLWWVFSDSIGLTQRRAMRQMEEKKLERRNRNLEALGLSTLRHDRRRSARELSASGAGRRAAKGPKGSA